MRAVVLFLLFSAVACVCVAVPGLGASPAEALLARYHAPLRNRRDTCTDLLMKTGEEPYSTCFQLLGPIQIGNVGTEADVFAYCDSSQDCPSVMSGFLAQVAAACGGGGFPEVDRAVEEECYRDPRAVFCGIDYFSMFNDTAYKTYRDNCVKDFNSGGGKDCSDNCKIVTQYIMDNYGCCYTIFEQFQAAIDGNTKRVDADVFKACQLTEPLPCGQKIARKPIAGI